MRPKRIWFEKEETKIVKTKGYVDIDRDYTQVYNCFSNISMKIQSASTFKVLFWLLAHKTSDSNGIDTSIQSHREFIQHLQRVNPELDMTYRTFSRSIRELFEAGALTKVGRGHYFANPYLFWKDEVEKRDELIRLETKDGEYLSLNPGT